MKYTYTTSHHDERGIINHSKLVNSNELLSLFKKYPWKEEYAVISTSKGPHDYDIPTIEFFEYLNEAYHIRIGMFKDESENELKFCILYEEKETKLITNSEASYILELFTNKNITELDHELYQLREEDANSKLNETKILNAALYILTFIFSTLTIMSYFEARKGMFLLLASITTILLVILFYSKIKKARKII